jgi:spore germination protein KB
MTKELISDKQAISLMILFIWGSTLVIGTGGEAKRDMWAALILGMLLGAAAAFLYCKILSSYHQKNVFDINQIVFGRPAGIIINGFYVFFAYTLGVLVLNNFAEFIATVGLSDTPKVASVLPIVILTIWGVKIGVEGLGRWAEFFLILLSVIVIIPTLLSIPQMEFKNIRPVLGEGIKPLISGTISAFSFPFAETVIFIMVFSCLKREKSCYKVFYTGLFFGGAVLVVISIRNIMVIGSELLSKNYFPSYIVVSRINIGDFIQRIETVNTVAFLIAGYVKICLCLLAASNGLKTIFKFASYQVLVTPIALTMFAASFIAYESVLETTKFVTEIYPIFAAIFQVLLPAITYIGIKTKGKTGQVG